MLLLVDSQDPPTSSQRISAYPMATGSAPPLWLSQSYFLFLASHSSWWTVKTRPQEVSSLGWEGQRVIMQSGPAT